MTIEKRRMLFDRMCTLAKEKNQEALIALMSEAQVCVNFQIGIEGQIDVFSPTSWLAWQGEHQAVAFLIERFDVSLVDVVLGYALRGDVDKVNEFIAKEKDSKERDFLKARTASNYLLGGHDKQANEIRCYQYEHIEADKAMYQGLIFGYAYRGDHDKVTVMMEQASYNEGVFDADAVMGYTAGRHFALAKGLIDANNKLIEYALLGNIVGGDFERANEWIARGANKNNAVNSYANSNYDEQVAELIEQGASQDLAVLGYAMGGNIAKVNSLVAKGANRQHAFDGYIKYRDNNTARTYQELFRLVTLTEDHQLRALLAATAQEKSTDLLTGANNLRQLMKEEGLSYLTALSIKKHSFRLWHLQAIPLLLQKKLPWDILVAYMQFIVPLSEKNELYTFFEKSSKVQQGQSWKMGQHTLFLRQATVMNIPKKELFLTQSELADCLNQYQSWTGIIIKPEAIKRLKLLQNKTDDVSYNEVMNAIKGTRSFNELNDENSISSSKKVLKFISEKFDEKLIRQLNFN
jgi:hypothetical protein